MRAFSFIARVHIVGLRLPWQDLRLERYVAVTTVQFNLESGWEGLGPSLGRVMT